MKPSALFPAAREQAYHLLFLLHCASLVAIRPTPSSWFEVERLIDEHDSRRAALHRLRKHGWVETAELRGQRVLRLTQSGRAALAGGRDPGPAWNRDWDGNWRILVFDLPRDASQARVRFWRWLRANHFGRLQGSTWLTPDPSAIV
jgi:DNA-binding transcriptional regulator PaaX